MTIKETPNKITAVLKVTATAEFFDDEASEETVRYAIEQALDDAMFDVDVALLKEQEAVKPKYIDGKRNHFIKCGKCNTDLIRGVHYCSYCGHAVQWDG